MTKFKKLKLMRETVMALHELRAVHGGIPVPVSAAPLRCEPSGVVACPALF